MMVVSSVSSWGGPAIEVKAAGASVSLVNPGFEEANMNGWTVTDETYSNIKNSKSDAHSGDNSFNYWYGTSYKFSLSQQLTGLDAGTYELRAWASGGGGETLLKLYAKEPGNGSAVWTTDMTNTGYNKWKQYTVGNIEVDSSGALEIGFEVDAPGETWGYFDDIELVRTDLAIPYDPNDFIKGVDISTLQAIEDAGVKYYEDGEEKDLLTILKDHGVNYIRLRLWNDPKESGQAPDGSYYNDKAHTIAMAKRVKDAGFKLLLDFHYSDKWAHPGQQVKPAAWKDLSYDELLEAVYDYTSDVLTELDTAGAYPDMVQIGNEINTGIIHPEGSTSNFDQMVQLLNQGIQAVRDTTPAGQDTQIMLHLAEGGKNGVFVDFFNKIDQAGGLDYDIIGISYYPYWHGTFYDLKDNMDKLVARYKKPVVVAETAYAFTPENGDGLANNVGVKEIETVGLPATEDNQKLVVETVMNTVASVEGHQGLGVFYWEPAWLKEVGWTTGEGNAWENQAMFDFKGHALSSLDAFKYVPGSLSTQPILVYPSTGVTVFKGEAPVLPDKADVQYNDGSMISADVVWDPIPADKLNQSGKFTLTGTVSGISQKAKIEITVKDQINYAKNYSFENGNLSDWILTGPSGVGKVTEDTGNAVSGKHAFNYWYDQDFAYELTQTVTGLPNGTYTLKAWVSGEKEDISTNKIHSAFELFAKDSSGLKQKADIETTGWNLWKQYTVNNIRVTDGVLTIGFNVEATAGMWGWIDDIELVQAVTPADPSTPTAPSTGSSPGSSPATTAPSTAVSSDNAGKIVTVTPEQLKPAGEGVVSLSVPAGASEVNLPVTAVSVVGDSSLEVKNEALSLVIPNEVLKKLIESAGGAADWSISLKLKQASADMVRQALEQAAGAAADATNIEPAGPMYDFHLSITASGSSAQELAKFDTPITITMNASEGADPNITGIYYLAPDGGLEYIPGTWKDGKITAQITHFSQYAVLKIMKRFQDVTDAHWAYTVVSSLAAKQIVAGTADGSFEPNREVTRAEFAAMLARALKLEPRNTTSFTDVSPDAWYADAVMAGYEAGILTGSDKGLFKPHEKITRQEMAVMVIRAYEMRQGSAAPAAQGLGIYKDEELISPWALPAVQAAYNLGLIKGQGQLYLAPRSMLSRAEAAQIVERLLNL